MSMLAGAVWRSNGHAFEEFSETKFKGIEKKASNGRIDLWLGISGQEFRAEVKHAEISITSKADPLTRLQDLMKQAIKDARCLPAAGKKNRRLAISFAVPYQTAKTPEAQRANQLTLFTKHLQKLDHDAIAWVFPSISKLPVAHGYVCPGIVVWIKIVKRSP